MKYILGIDPGINGALAYLSEDECIIYDVPAHTVKSKRVISLYDLASIIDRHSQDTKEAVIERVSAMPGQGVTSMFSFGYGYGCLKMAVAANLIPLTEVSPQRWKRDLGLSKDKRESVSMAIHLFPQYEALFKGARGGLKDGRAEAALLAYWHLQNL